MSKAEAARRPARLEQPAPLGQQKSIDDVLSRIQRPFVPIRSTFVQQGRGRATKPGPVAQFLTSRDGRGLDAYLLVHALASAPPWDCTLASGFWVRALGLVADANLSGETLDLARPAVSKIMKRLVDRKLIYRERRQRRSSLVLLREDGSQLPYLHPFETSDKWFSLPHDYWHKGHYRRLSLAAKVMLLVSLELPETFTLPQNRAPSWYGVSEDSAQRGLRDLRTTGLLHADQGWVKDARSDTGWTQRWSYQLLGSYSTAARKAAAASAKANYESSLAEAL